VIYNSLLGSTLVNDEKLQIKTSMNTTGSTSLLRVAEQRVGTVALKMHKGAFYV
jgi:hypothetical protein